MKLRPSQNALAIAVGLLALAVATTGTAVAVTGTAMNITDPVNAAYKAHVDSAGRLTTTSSVFGTVTAHAALPSTFFTGVAVVQSSASSGGCVVVYAPPSGKAAVITQVQGNQYGIGTPAGTVLRFWVSPTSTPCNATARVFLTGADKPITVTEDLGEGWGIPAGWSLFADEFTNGSASDSWLATAQGYTTTGTSVPVPAAVTTTGLRGPAVAK